jgi:hypothetical protein
VLCKPVGETKEYLLPITVSELMTIENKYGYSGKSDGYVYECLISGSFTYLDKDRDFKKDSPLLVHIPDMAKYEAKPYYYVLSKSSSFTSENVTIRRKSKIANFISDDGSYDTLVLAPFRRGYKLITNWKG